jgi:hypothetical protein
VPCHTCAPPLALLHLIAGVAAGGVEGSCDESSPLFVVQLDKELRHLMVNREGPHHREKPQRQKSRVARPPPPPAPPASSPQPSQWFRSLLSGGEGGRKEQGKDQQRRTSTAPTSGGPPPADMKHWSFARSSRDSTEATAPAGAAVRATKGSMRRGGGNTAIARAAEAAWLKSLYKRNRAAAEQARH